RASRCRNRLFARAEGDFDAQERVAHPRAKRRFAATRQRNDSGQNEVIIMKTTNHRHYENGYSTNSREIEQDIERTRQEMDETLDEISERLNPRHLLDEVLDMFRSEGTNRGRQYAARQAKSAGKKAARVAGKQMARTVKEHPLPSMLIAAGVAWMLYDEMF